MTSTRGHKTGRDSTAPFLFSVDLEDVRTMVPDGERYRDGVTPSVHRYLDLLDRHQMRCTFFTVGNVARSHPALVHEIAEAGHEIACHSSEHRVISDHDSRTFRDDVRRNIDDLLAAGAHGVAGFRAPMMSMTPDTDWAYDVLRELGIEYSSSVLPGANPLHGWPGHPDDATRHESGIWEIPVSMSRWPILDVPFACGVYFRVLPFAAQRHLCRRQGRSRRPIVMYCHPYDIDTEQEFISFPGLAGNRLFNWLMYVGRGKMIARLDRLLADVGPIIPYNEYVAELSGGVGGHGASS